MTNIFAAHDFRAINTLKSNTVAGLKKFKNVVLLLTSRLIFAPN